MKNESEQSTYVGQWWLPQRPEQVIHGSLEIGLHHPELSIYESLPFGQEGIAREPDYSIIHGRSMGVGVTLLDSHQVSERSTQQGENEETYKVFVANTVLIGDEPLNEEECRFDRAHFRLFNLDQWSNRAVYKHSESAIEVLDLPALTASIPGCEVSLQRSIITNLGRLTDAGFTSHEVIELKIEERVTLEELEHKFIRPLEQMLTLATGKHCEAFSLAVGNYDKTKDWRDTWPIKSYSVRRKKTDQKQPGKPMIRERMRFGMNSQYYPPNVEFGVLVPNWYELQAKLSSACDWVFSLHSEVGGYLQQQVFTIASAIEALHRGLNPDYEEKTDDDRARNKAILSVVKKECPDHHQWLADTIRFAHRKTYVFRGRELLQYTDNLMAEIVGDQEKWLQEVRKIRDGIGHVLNSSDDYTVEQMVALLRSARLFAELVLLRQLGFSTEECRQALRHNWESENAKHRMENSFAEWFAAPEKG
ncbi:ApeA N-terminal domain 1-containing protein [Streptomyces phaeochromogenes]|uniref:ApeA N-terminal domain 1-containing protein n=1 Tax=Streptomyces phaeochromogenes TaxID=1923 RepID=UPI003723590D